MNARPLVAVFVVAACSASATPPPATVPGDPPHHGSTTGQATTGGSATMPPAAGNTAPATPERVAPAAQSAPPPAPAPARRFPPPPEYTEIHARMRNDPRGARCFVHNVIMADLTAAYVDGDFDGDGRSERIWQLPDCIAVIVQGQVHWEIPVLAPRVVAREVASVSLRAVRRAGALVVQVTDTRTDPASHEVFRFQWNGRELVAVP